MLGGSPQSNIGCAVALLLIIVWIMIFDYCLDYDLIIPKTGKVVLKFSENTPCNGPELTCI
jgi:hypothetical protein